MAKKNKKQTRKVSGTRARFESRVAPVQASPSETPAPRASGPDFNPDYSQTIKDLKRIGFLAGSFIAILVVISFFLR
jgi:hypothetical protein